MSEGEAAWGDNRSVDWENSPDLTSLSKDKLGSILKQLVQQEHEVSYQRRVLQGRIDLIRTELVRRGEASLSPEELAQILMDRGRGGPDA